MTHKNRKKSRIFMFLSTGRTLLGAEGFSCSLGVLYVGLGIGKLKFLKKNFFFFSAVIFLSIFVIKAWIRNRDPDPESGSAIRKNSGSGSVSGSALNQCGSETLVIIVPSSGPRRGFELTSSRVGVRHSDQMAS
jgi:hypothetical protein